MLKKMDRASRRRLQGWTLSALTALLLTSQPVRTLTELPDSIHLTRGYSTSLTLSALLEADIDGSAAALSSLDETLLRPGALTLSAQQPGSSSLTLRLMGLFPFKTIPVNVEEEKILIPGGFPVGVAIRTQGVLIVGASDLGGSTISPARQAGLLPGDLIREVDGIAVSNSQHLSRLLSSGKEVLLTIVRGDNTFTLPLTPALDPRDNVYRLGAWVRDSTAGIGTLSFYDPESGRYGALGHAITDVDTGQVLDVQNGEIIESSITQIHRGEAGAPGELIGQFSADSEPLGSIDTNSVCGIYGDAFEDMICPLYPQGVPIMSSDEVQIGDAQILTTLDETGIQAYDCEITKIARQSGLTQRNLILHITDEELLQKTGGIVQGMSGSPILQDGRLVGAVTHVFINDPTTGYGIFIENMLDAAG